MVPTFTYMVHNGAVVGGVGEEVTSKWRALTGQWTPFGNGFGPFGGKGGESWGVFPWGETVFKVAEEGKKPCFPPCPLRL